MKKLKVIKGVECMNCWACLMECSESYFKIGNPDYAALAIVAQRRDPSGTRPLVCMQCGECAEACPTSAIIQNKQGVYMVNKKLCNGCGECVEVCPFHLMKKPEESKFAFKCIACGKCAAACPQGILEVSNA